MAISPSILKKKQIDAFQKWITKSLMVKLSDLFLKSRGESRSSTRRLTFLLRTSLKMSLNKTSIALSHNSEISCHANWRVIQMAPAEDSLTSNSRKLKMLTKLLKAWTTSNLRDRNSLSIDTKRKKQEGDNSQSSTICSLVIYPPELMKLSYKLYSENSERSNQCTYRKMTRATLETQALCASRTP